MFNLRTLSLFSNNFKVSRCRACFKACTPADVSKFGSTRSLCSISAKIPTLLHIIAYWMFGSIRSLCSMQAIIQTSCFIASMCKAEQPLYEVCLGQPARSAAEMPQYQPVRALLPCPKLNFPIGQAYSGRSFDLRKQLQCSNLISETQRKIIHPLFR